MRLTLAITLMAALAIFMAGNVLAQTDPDQYSQSGTTGTTGTTDTTTGTTDPNMQNSGTTTDSSATTSATTTTTDTNDTDRTMPRTASSEPLLLLIGLSALVGVFALRFFRLLRAR